MKEYISKESATKEIERWEGYLLDEDMIGRMQIGINKLPAEKLPEESFIKWVIDMIWDDEYWEEYNYEAFPELVCRKLLVMGYLKLDEDGNYERNYE